MTNRNRVRLSKLSLGLAIALAAAPAFAQNTTAALGGRITTADGQPVTGAQVTILHNASGTVSNATSGADGRYAARGLRVGGPYTVTITKDGKTETREGVYLQLAEVGTVDAKLGDTTTTLAAVQVTGTSVTSELFSADKMGTGTSISRDQLEAFASIRRDLQDYARQDPRVSQSTDNFGTPQISVAGQNNRFNSITIDGVTTNDTFGLESNNLPTAKQPVSIDSIDSVQINVSNYDVTQTGYTGANINAVTKSGTNEFHGTLSYVYRDEDMSGDRYNPTTDTYAEPAPFEEETKGFTFGGPLLKDTLFFFLAYEEYTSSRAGVDFGPVGSSLTNVGITQAEIDTAIGIAERPCGAGTPTTCGMEVGDSIVPGGTELAVKDSLIKLDWNINENHRASLRYNKTEQAEPFIRNFGPTSLSLSSHWDTQVKTFETFVGSIFSDWTENFSTELKVSYRDYDSFFDTNSNLPDISVQFRDPAPPGTATGNRTLRMGSEFSRHFNELRTETLDAYLAANWYRGDHQFKFGGDLSSNDIFNAFQQSTRGNYVFQCLLASQCNNSFQAGIPLTYTSTQPQVGRTLTDAAAIWGIDNIGVFMQDTWAVNYNLNVNYGLRVDMVNIDGKPLLSVRPDGTSIAAPVIPGTGQFGRQTGGMGFRNDVTIDGSKLYQPRVGFNYTFDSDRPTQLRGGIGLFQGASANVWLSNPFTNTGMAVQTVGCGGSLPACVGNVFSSDPNNQPRPAASAPQFIVDIIDPELEQPAVWKANLGWEHELPFWGLVFSAEAIFTRNQNAIFYQHLNLGEATTIGPDGRRIFWNANGLDRDCWNAFGTITSTAPGCGGSVTSRARSNSSYGNVIIARPTDKGGGESFTLALSRPMKDNWSWSFAYTRTEATEVAALTSSTSNSQWNGRSSFDPNEEVENNSTYAIKDRFSGTLNWRHYFFDGYKTEIGLFYDGHSGRPFSWTYFDDANGDGIGFNDLLYIPQGPGSGEVVFRGGAAEEAQFWTLVAQLGLSGYAGRVVPRNSQDSPWSNQFDLRISQELPGFFDDHRTVMTLDVLNIGNLINKEWGQMYDTFYPSLNRNFVNIVGIDNGRYVYSIADGASDYQIRNFRGESSWGAQFTIRYEF